MNRTITASPSLWNRIVRFWESSQMELFFHRAEHDLVFHFHCVSGGTGSRAGIPKSRFARGTWVGLKNFQDLGSSKLFWSSMEHTLVYAVFIVVAWIASSMLVASLIQPLSNRVQSLFRAAFTCPM